MSETLRIEEVGVYPEHFNDYIGDKFRLVINKLGELNLSGEDLYEEAANMIADLTEQDKSAMGDRVEIIRAEIMSDVVDARGDEGFADAFYRDVESARDRGLLSGEEADYLIGEGDATGDVDGVQGEQKAEDTDTEAKVTQLKPRPESTGSRDFSRRVRTVGTAALVLLSSTLGIGGGEHDLAAASIPEATPSLGHGAESQESVKVEDTEKDVVSATESDHIVGKWAEPISPEDDFVKFVKAIESVGLNLTQVRYVEDWEENIAAHSPIEASEKSMNTGKTVEEAQDGVLTVNDAIRISQQTLRGDFGDDRAWDAIQTMADAGYTPEEIREFADTGAIGDARAFVFSLNSDRANVENTPYVDSKGNVQYDTSREVGANDYFIVTIHEDGRVTITRIECGALIQPGKPVLPKSPKEPTTPKSHEPRTPDSPETPTPPGATPKNSKIAVNGSDSGTGTSEGAGRDGQATDDNNFVRGEGVPTPPREVPAGGDPNSNTGTPAPTPGKEQGSNQNPGGPVGQGNQGDNTGFTNPGSV